jgi:hypothetical protein
MQDREPRCEAANGRNKPRCPRVAAPDMNDRAISLCGPLHQSQRYDAIGLSSSFRTWGAEIGPIVWLS